MTPKEKSQEIFNHFFEIEPIDKETALQCSLILVDELREEWCIVWDEVSTDCDYWNEVEQELRSLDISDIPNIEQ
jgi:hypothetical protein